MKRAEQEEKGSPVPCSSAAFEHSTMGQEVLSKELRETLVSRNSFRWALSSSDTKVNQTPWICSKRRFINCGALVAACWNVGFIVIFLRYAVLQHTRVSVILAPARQGFSYPGPLVWQCFTLARVLWILFYVDQPTFHTICTHLPAPFTGKTRHV